MKGRDVDIDTYALNDRLVDLLIEDEAKYLEEEIEAIAQAWVFI